MRRILSGRSHVLIVIAVLLVAAAFACGKLFEFDYTKELEQELAITPANPFLNFEIDLEGQSGWGTYKKFDNFVKDLTVDATFNLTNKGTDQVTCQFFISEQSYDNLNDVINNAEPLTAEVAVNGGETVSDIDVDEDLLTSYIEDEIGLFYIYVAVVDSQGINYECWVTDAEVSFHIKIGL